MLRLIAVRVDGHIAGYAESLALPFKHFIQFTQVIARCGLVIACRCRSIVLTRLRGVTDLATFCVSAVGGLACSNLTS